MHIKLLDIGLRSEAPSLSRPDCNRTTHIDLGAVVCEQRGNYSLGRIWCAGSACCLGGLPCSFELMELLHTVSDLCACDSCTAGAVLLRARLHSECYQ